MGLPQGSGNSMSMPLQGRGRSHISCRMRFKFGCCRQAMRTRVGVHSRSSSRSYRPSSIKCSPRSVAGTSTGMIAAEPGATRAADAVRISCHSAPLLDTDMWTSCAAASPRFSIFQIRVTVLMPLAACGCRVRPCLAGGAHIGRGVYRHLCQTAQPVNTAVAAEALKRAMSTRLIVVTRRTLSAVRS